MHSQTIGRDESPAKAIAGSHSDTHCASRLTANSNIPAYVGSDLSAGEVSTSIRQHTQLDADEHFVLVQSPISAPNEVPRRRLPSVVRNTNSEVLVPQEPGCDSQDLEHDWREHVVWTFPCTGKHKLTGPLECFFVIVKIKNSDRFLPPP
jgi:hypothetical protein